MIDDIVAAALERWRAGGFDRIECALVRAPRDVVVSLTEAYRMEPDASVREAIVYSIWKRRESENLEFLVDALRDPDRRVWQEALDGIVTLGSAHARAS
ncbi:MAG: hypothetical protein HYR85_14815, partial [Planctomycetes bacterium]|nr:hypothetical protein [Planctomycetota bacterium]